MLIDKESSELLQGDHSVSDSPAKGPSLKVHPSEQLVPRMIAAQARLNPDRVALVMGSEKLTYAELELRATQLANYLRIVGGGTRGSCRPLCGSFAAICHCRPGHHAIWSCVSADGLGASSGTIALHRQRCRRPPAGDSAKLRGSLRGFGRASSRSGRREERHRLAADSIARTETGDR